MPLDASVIDSVANSNFKNQGEMPMQFSNILLNDALIAGRNMTAIREKSVSRSLERMDVTNDDEGANVSASYGALIALVQQLAKMSQTTNPETGK
jgi:uncharacterized iron-regulated protein